MKKVFFLSTYILSLIACSNSTKEKSIPSEPQIEKELITSTQVKEEIIEIGDPEVENIIKEKQESTKEIKASSETIIKEKKIITSKNESTPKKEKVVTKEKVNTKLEKTTILLKPKHDIWNSLTNSYVSTNGKVNYNAFKANLSKLDTYLKELESLPPKRDWSTNEKLAYWFNLYNASTVYLVASNYPVKSIKDINSGKPWDKKFIKSGANVYSLNQIENTIVRPNFNEPRLHLAFNCAAISCPNLLNEAFTANKLNNQLNSLSKKWINDTSKNKISENEIQISKIFEWYAVDFKKGVVSFINTYSSTKTAINPKISYLEYNWNLND